MDLSWWIYGYLVALALAMAQLTVFAALCIR
jgi:hypothetical protein